MSSPLLYVNKHKNTRVATYLENLFISPEESQRTRAEKKSAHRYQPVEKRALDDLPPPKNKYGAEIFPHQKVSIFFKARFSSSGRVFYWQTNSFQIKVLFIFQSDLQLFFQCFSNAFCKAVVFCPFKVSFELIFSRFLLRFSFVKSALPNILPLRLLPFMSRISFNHSI